MALQGNLRIFNKSYDIIECSYEFSQSVDETGKPTSRPHGGTITFVTPSTSDADVFFYRWMFNKTQVYNGQFRFGVYTTRNRTSYKTLTFENAYCIGLRDYFNDNDSKLMYTTVTISAEILRFGTLDSATFTNEWT